MEEKKEKVNTSNFSFLPAYVRLSKEISELDKIIFAEIGALTYLEGYCYASNDYIAQLHGKTERTISACISRLAQRGFVSIVYVNNRRRIYIDPAKDDKQLKIPSYIEVLKEQGVTDEDYINAIFDFLKHCQINGRKVINKKLVDIVHELDRRHSGNVAAKIADINNAIKRGWFGIFEVKEAEKTRKNELLNYPQREYTEDYLRSIHGPIDGQTV